MKWIKIALAGCVSLLAMTAHAHADFIFTPLTFLLFSSPIGAVLGPGAIYAGLQIAAYAAVLGAQIALSRRQQPKIDPGQLKNTFQEAETPEYNAVGRVRLGGLKAFGNTSGQYIYRLIWHCKGPMVAIEEYHVGGRSVVVEDNGRVSSPPWVTSGGSYLYIRSKAGTGNETAWDWLLSAFPNLWTSAHRCRGIFQSLARYRTPDLDSEEGNKKFQKLYQGGPPDIMVTARVSPVYDPRDPSQNPDTPSTWKWTDNGVLVAVHIMRQYPDLKSSDFDWSFIAAEADRADEEVETLNGTEKRARCWGIWPSENPRGEVMQQVLDSIGAEVVLSDEGKIRIRLIDDNPVSEMDFPSRHILELNWKSGPEAVERPNVCRVSYYSPERGYDMGEINLSGVSWARVQDEIDRYGEKIFDVELPFCPSASQAQRIARRLFLQARADAGDIKTNMAGMAAWDVTYATIRDEDAGEDMLCRIASPRADSQSGEVSIPYIVWPKELIDNPWDPQTMEAPPPEEAPELEYESELPKPAKPAEATVVQYPGGGYETRVRFTGVSGGTVAEARYRTYTDGNPNLWQSMTEYQGSGNTWYGWDAADARGERADFRTQFFNSDDEGSYPSDILTVEPMEIDNTAPGAPDVSVSVDDPGGSAFADVTWTITVPDLNAVKVTVEIFVAFPEPTWNVIGTINDIRPGVAREIQGILDAGSSVSYRVAAYTSDDTRGAYAMGVVNVPGGND